MELANKKTRVAALSVASNSVLILLKVAVGILTGSVAVLSEAIHSAVDLVAAVIALFAVRTSARSPDERHPYGHGKYENLSGTIEALLIFVAAAWIIYEAVQKLISPREMDMPVWGVAVMFVSAVANIFVSRRLFRVGKETDSVALQADAWHLRTDVYTSIGVMIGLLIILIGRGFWPDVNLRWVDPVVAILVALMIMKTAWDLTRESARDLLDVSLPHEDVHWISDFVNGGWPSVRSFHHLQTRKAGPHRFIDFHVVVEESMSVADAHTLADEIVVAIKARVPESRVHIHVEPCDYRCKPACVVGCTVEPEEREARRAERTKMEVKEAPRTR